MSARGRPEIKPHPSERISKARYKDPKQNLLNTEKFNHIRKNKTVKKKISVGKKIRDVKRLLARLEASEDPNAEMIKAQQEKLSMLTKQKRTNRSAKFIDQKYKNVKFYGKLPFCH